MELVLIGLKLGMLFFQQDQHVKAELILQQSLTVAREISQVNEDVAYALLLLGYMYISQRKNDMGETTSLQSIEMYTHYLGKRTLAQLKLILCYQKYTGFRTSFRNRKKCA